MRVLGHDVRFPEIAVEDETSVKAAADRVRQEDGKLDALVNNSGVSGAFVEPADQLTKNPSVPLVNDYPNHNLLSTLRSGGYLTPRKTWYAAAR